MRGLKNKPLYISSSGPTKPDLARLRREDQRVLIRQGFVPVRTPGFDFDAELDHLNTLNFRTQVRDAAILLCRVISERGAFSCKSSELQKTQSVDEPQVTNGAIIYAAVVMRLSVVPDRASWDATISCKASVP